MNPDQLRRVPQTVRFVKRFFEAGKPPWQRFVMDPGYWQRRVSFKAVTSHPGPL